MAASGQEQEMGQGSDSKGGASPQRRAQRGSGSGSRSRSRSPSSGSSSSERSRSRSRSKSPSPDPGAGTSKDKGKEERKGKARRDTGVGADAAPSRQLALRGEEDEKESMSRFKTYAQSAMESWEKKKEALEARMKQEKDKLRKLQALKGFDGFKSRQFDKLCLENEWILRLFLAFLDLGVDMAKNIIPFVPVTLERDEGGLKKLVDYLVVSKSAFEHVVDQWSKTQTKIEVKPHLSQQAVDFLAQCSEPVPFDVGFRLEKKLCWGSWIKSKKQLAEQEKQQRKRDKRSKRAKGGGEETEGEETEDDRDNGEEEDEEEDKKEGRASFARHKRFRSPYVGPLSFLRLEFLVELKRHFLLFQEEHWRQLEYPPNSKHFVLEQQGFYYCNNRSETRKQINLRFLPDQLRNSLLLHDEEEWTLVADWPLPEEALRGAFFAWSLFREAKYQTLFPQAFDNLKTWDVKKSILRFHWKLEHVKPQPFLSTVVQCIRKANPSFDPSEHQSLFLFWPFCCNEKFDMDATLHYVAEFQKANPQLNDDPLLWPLEERAAFLQQALKDLGLSFSKRRPGRRAARASKAAEDE